MDALINPVDWRRIGAIFSEAMDREPGKRAEFVRARAEGDPLILREVMSLLASDEESGGFLEAPLSLCDRPTGTLTGLRGLDHERAPVCAAGEAIAGRFRIVRMLGAGGMGEVYEAADLLASGARIALKTISTELAGDAKNREAFRAEVLAARAVTHTGVCRVHELHDDPAHGGMFLTMELLEGRNLSSFISERKEADFAGSARLFLQIAEAVGAAHAAGILHCDIKTSNVIVVTEAKGKRPVVTDFGLARVVGLSGGHLAGGTPDYMAPEIFNGSAPSFTSDVFALGVLAVELLTGERLPHRLSDLTGLSDVSRDRVLPGALKRGPWSKLVGRCLDNDPGRRFPSAVELAAAVDRLIDRKWRLTRRAILAAAVVAPLAAYYTYERLHPAGVTAVAILPFEDRGPGNSFEFLADSIPGELIRALSPVHGLRVTALTSTSRFRGSSASPIEIGQRLNVDFVLQGSVEERDGGVALNVAAVSGKTGRTVWTSEFRRGPGESNLELRQEVVLAMAGALPFALAPTQLVRLRGQPTTNAAAYDEYLLGMQLAANRAAGWAPSAIDHFADATRVDPNFALAYAQLSLVLCPRAGSPGFPADETLRRAEAAAQRALQLDDALPEGHQAMGTIRQHRYFDWTGAEAHYREAIRLNPGLAIAHQMLAGLLSNLRRVPEALAEVRLARQLDPASPPVNALYGAILQRSYRTDEAIDQLKFTTQLAPSNLAPWTLLGEAYAQKADWIQAEAAYRRSLEIDPADASSQAGLAYAYARAGRLDDANALLDGLIRDKASQVAIGAAYIGLNRFDDAITCLETAWRNRDPTVSSMAAETANDQLRQFPRFTALLKKLSLP